MKNKIKGFTLIELLVIITILLLTSLIVTPLILGCVNCAKETRLSSVSTRYIDAVNSHNELSIYDEKYTKLVPGYYDVNIINTLLNIDDEPTDGWIIINYEGEVELGVIEYNYILENEIVLFYNNEVKIKLYKEDIVNPIDITTDSLEELLVNIYPEIKLNTIIE